MNAAANTFISVLDQRAECKKPFDIYSWVRMLDMYRIELNYSSKYNLHENKRKTFLFRKMVIVGLLIFYQQDIPGIDPGCHCSSRVCAEHWKSDESRGHFAQSVPSTLQVFLQSHDEITM